LPLPSTDWPIELRITLSEPSDARRSKEKTGGGDRGLHCARKSEEQSEGFRGTRTYSIPLCITEGPIAILTMHSPAYLFSSPTQNATYSTKTALRTSISHVYLGIGIKRHSANLVHTGTRYRIVDTNKKKKQCVRKHWTRCRDP
jgi:hypothetical protein